MLSSTIIPLSKFIFFSSLIPFIRSVLPFCSSSFHPPFRLIILFSTGVSSWRLYMMVHQGVNSFSKFSSRFISRKLKHSSSCNPECNFSLPYLWRWYYAILDNLSSCVMIHMLLRMRYFKSINLIIGVILGYISTKAFPKDCCYLWCL